MTLEWTRAFIGIPYLDKGRSAFGADCWGFVRLVYAARLGIELPSFEGEYVSAEERREIATIVAREAQSALWERVDEPRELDIMFFRKGRFDGHAALWIEPGLMLHMREDDSSKIERFDVPAWQNRITGIYRWRG